MTANDMAKSARQRAHTVQLDDRERLVITGVRDVLSFNEEEVELLCEQERMEVAGENLHIVKLNLEEGQVVIEGSVNAMEYQCAPERAGVFARFFG